MVYGGPPPDIHIVVTCPETKKPIPTDVAVPADEEFVRVVMWPHANSDDAPDTAQSSAIITATPAEQSRSAAPATAPGVRQLDDEYADWARSSRATGLDYGKNMLTTSTAAVGVYFAVLKYLGYENASHNPRAFWTVLPPALFTCACVAFAIGLRPALSRVSRAGFQALRDSRLRHIDRFLTLGTILLVLGLGAAVVVYVDLLIVR